MFAARAWLLEAAQTYQQSDRPVIDEPAFTIAMVALTLFGSLLIVGWDRHRREVSAEQDAVETAAHEVATATGVLAVMAGPMTEETTRALIVGFDPDAGDAGGELASPERGEDAAALIVEVVDEPVRSAPRPERLEDLVDLVERQGGLWRRVRELSRGSRSRLAISRARKEGELSRCSFLPVWIS